MTLNRPKTAFARPRWEFTPPKHSGPDGLSSGKVLENGGSIICHASQGPFVHGLNPRTGKLDWQFDCRQIRKLGEATSVFVDGSHLILSSTGLESLIVRLDGKGQPQILFRVGEWGAGTVCKGTGYFLGRETFASIRVSDGTIAGRRLGEYRSDAPYILYSRYGVIGGDKASSSLVFVHPDSGEVLGRLATGRSVSFDSLQVQDDTLVVLYHPGAVMLIDIATRKVKFELEGEHACGPLAFSGKRLYWGALQSLEPDDTACSIVAFNLETLKVEHSVSSPIPYLTDLLILPDRILVGGDGLASLDPKDLSVQWAVKDKKLSAGKMLVTDDFFACTSWTNRLLCFDRKVLEGPSAWK